MGGLVVMAGGVFVAVAALERLTSPMLRALGGREQSIVIQLLVTGIAIAILGVYEAAGFTLLPRILPSVVACLGAMFAGTDFVRIFLDSLRWLGSPPGPLAAVPSASNSALLFGAVLSGGGGVLLALGHTGAFARTEQNPAVSKTTSDLVKTYHAGRWWMRDRSGSVLVWDDQAQAWSPWVDGRDPGLPPGWS